MLIYLVRHAKAQPRLCGADHPNRRLTDKGQAQAQQLAIWFAEQTVKPQVLFTSPYRRCVETAAPIATALKLPLQTVDWLSHGNSVQECLKQLAQRSTGQVQVWVGHEPELSSVLEALLDGEQMEMSLSFSKAGVACLTRDQSGWRLLWQYRFKQLMARKQD